MWNENELGRLRFKFMIMCLKWVNLTLSLSTYQASAFVVTYPVNNVVNEAGNENEKAVSWEKAFIQVLKVFAYILQ